MKQPPFGTYASDYVAVFAVTVVVVLYVCALVSFAVKACQ